MSRRCSCSSSYHLLILSLTGVWAVLGLSWNILGGYAGLVSFGQAAFFGGGAYTVAILFHYLGVSPWIGCLLGGVVGCALAVLVGWITFRLRGHYFSLAMLAYPLALIPVFTWAGWTEVSLPLQRTAPLAYMQFADPRVMPLLVLALLGASLAVCLRIERTRLGLQLYAIRQNELAAQCAGIETLRVKLVAIAIAGAHGRARGQRLRDDRAGGDAGVGVRDAGLGAGADRQHVRRPRHRLGAADRGGDPGAAGRGAQRQHRRPRCPACRASCSGSPSSP